MNGVEYEYGDPEVILESEMIRLSGITFEEENLVCLEYIEDALGAWIEPYCFTFYQDTLPPEYTAFPPESMQTSDPSPEITVVCSDFSGAYPD